MRSSNLPCFALSDAANHVSTDLVSLGQINTPVLRQVYGARLTFGQLRKGMLLTGQRGLASLGNLVRHVVVIRAQEKVGGIDAGWVIAAVKDMHAVRYWADIGHICEAVSQDGKSRQRLKATIWKQTEAVSIPCPAPIPFVELLFKATKDVGKGRHVAYIIEAMHIGSFHERLCRVRLTVQTSPHHHCNPFGDVGT